MLLLMSRDFRTTSLRKSYGHDSSRDCLTTLLRKSRGLRVTDWFSNHFSPKLLRILFIAGFSNDFTPTIPQSWFIAGFLNNFNPKIQRSWFIAGFSNNFIPKIPWSPSHRGIFERLHSENPAVSDSSRDFQTTSLQESGGLQAIAGFSDFTPKIRRSLSIAGFSENFTPKIPRSWFIAGFLDDFTPKSRGLASSLDFRTTSVQKSRCLRVIAGFAENWTTKTLSWSYYVPSHSQGMWSPNVYLRHLSLFASGLCEDVRGREASPRVKHVDHWQ